MNSNMVSSAGADTQPGAAKTVADHWRWERIGCRVYSATFHRGRPLKVADVSFGGLDEDGINARGLLIAAAPELLESIRPLAPADEETAARFAALDPDDTVSITIPVRCILKAHAAILKATTAAGSTLGGREG